MLQKTVGSISTTAKATAEYPEKSKAKKYFSKALK